METSDIYARVSLHFKPIKSIATQEKSYNLFEIKMCKKTIIFIDQFYFYRY